MSLDYFHVLLMLVWMRNTEGASEATADSYSILWFRNCVGSPNLNELTSAVGEPTHFLNHIGCLSISHHGSHQQRLATVGSGKAMPAVRHSK